MTSTTAWFFEGKEFTEEQIGKHVGFVYLITNTVTNKKYIGKKLFTKSKSYQKNKKKLKTRVSSDWQNYWGSNDLLKEDVKTFGEDKFTREILYLCTSKGWLSYYETREQFVRDALLPGSDYYNDWIMVRIRRSHLTTKSKGRL